MGSEWRTVTTNDISARISMGPFGSNIKTDNFVDEGVPIIRGNNLNNGRFNGTGFVFLTEEKADQLRTSNAYPEDIVFTHRGTLGQVGIIPMGSYSRYVVSQSQMVMTCDRSLAEPLFVYYYFQSRFGQHELLKHTSQTGVPAISRPVTALKSIKFQLPPLSEQRAIASILGALDDKIELNRRMNQTLEAMAQAVFKSWFVDFDPVRHKAAGHEPPGMAPEIADLFPDAFEESELGEIPMGWEVSTIDDVCERIGMGPFGSSIKVSTFTDSGIPIINGQHLNGILLEDNRHNFISDEHADRLKSANVWRGDLVLTHRGNIGQISLIPRTSKYERYIVSQSQFYLRCNLDYTFPSFLLYYLRSHKGQHRLLSNTSGSGVPAISQPVSYVKTIKFVCPDKHLAKQYDLILDKIHMKIGKNRQNAEKLASIRDTLLPKLISGELRVPKAEKMVEQVM